MCERLEPVLASLSLQNYTFFVVSSASSFWVRLDSLFSLNFRRLRPYFPRFGQRTVCWHALYTYSRITQNVALKLLP
jgi:hypothetical protein